MADASKQPIELTPKEEAAHFQQLLRELAISDGGVGSDGTENFDQISYVIKQILQTGKEDVFADQLTGFIHRKEAEIEKMCVFHYQEFVQSVDQLLKVRQGTVTLKDKIKDLNEQMQSSGSKTIAKKKEIIESRQTLLNIELAVESLQSCLFVLDIANKVNASVESRKYYSALKMLEELQATHLRPVTQYSFAKHMQEYIPIMQENIREAVLEEMQEWLVNIRENTRGIGKLALEHIAAKQDKAKDKAGKLARGMSVSASSLNLGQSLELLADHGDDHENDETRIDFRPLYQCLHIHEVLDKRNDFRSLYEEKRRMQARLLVGQRFSFETGDLSGFDRYLHDVVGFFIIEAIVMNSTQNFRSRSGVESLWSNATDKMNEVITDSLQDCRDPDLFLAIKLRVVNFIDTMESYGFAVTSLMDLMLSLLDRYAELMKSKCSESLVETVEEDEYAPMIVNDQQEYDKVTLAFKLKDDSKTRNLKYVSKEWASSIRFPKTLPFSKGFPQCCDRIKQFITGFYRFAEGFEQQYNEMDDLLKKSLENLLVQTLNGTLMRKIMVNNMSQVVQIMINLEYFEMACAEFEQLLMENKTAHKAGIIRLSATQIFKESRMMAEKRLFELLNMKMDEFLELADYDWNTPLAAKSQDGHSAYLDDLVTFMNAIITSTLINLPSNMRSQIYLGAFKHLASAIYGLLLDPDVKRLSPGIIDIFDNDVAFLEKFAAGVGEASVTDAFAELRQTILLLKTPNYEDILNPAIRDKRYSRIKFNNLAVVLEKMKGDTSVFAKSTPAEKAKRKSIDAVLKGIKTQQASSPTK
ncbi:hypothetical protein SpCBS45565_g03037 [Spizellomyces sp. 'palustris']|nr:hypothetical protein SpCBS45565_g03037 [Spizellomyces sp. 'palustris']